MPGAPPVRLVSVAVTRCNTVFGEGELRTGDAEVQLGARCQGALERRATELSPVATDPLVEHQLRVAVVPEVETEIQALAGVLGSHCRAYPLPTAELGGGDFDLEDWSLT